MAADSKFPKTSSIVTVSMVFVGVLVVAIIAGSANVTLNCFSVARIDVVSNGYHLRSSSFFDKVVEDSYGSILSKSADQRDTQHQQSQQGTRRKFDLTEWKTLYNRDGGLTDTDRTMLGDIYGAANSVFEYGLGESTAIANHVGVSRYAGIDSDVSWVNFTRSNVNPDYRFYFADVGSTKAWGVPTNESLSKIAHQYQIAPLAAERAPFDVYMVDGRYRPACVFASFLHASSFGSMDPIVLLHDCYQKGHSPDDAQAFRRRKEYKVIDTAFDLFNHSKGYLCAYKRRSTTTDDEIYQLWLKNRNVVG